jgi:hypothetical protein
MPVIVLGVSAMSSEAHLARLVGVDIDKLCGDRALHHNLEPRIR